MPELRERGIYTLPNGMVFVVRVIGPGHYLLHDLIEDARNLHYHGVDASGRIIALKAQPISRRIEDLIDTGRTQTGRRRSPESPG